MNDAELLRKFFDLGSVAIYKIEGEVSRRDFATIKLVAEIRLPIEKVREAQKLMSVFHQHESSEN